MLLKYHSASTINFPESNDENMENDHWNWLYKETYMLIVLTSVPLPGSRMRATALYTNLFGQKYLAHIDLK